jgi:GNAT superfamily N-acetyltransferase
MPNLSMTTRCGVPSDLTLVLEWTGWTVEELLPPAMRLPTIEQALPQLRFRVLTAQDDGRTVGISVVTAAPQLSAVTWKLPNYKLVPPSECLYWVAVVVDPERRRRQIGRLLFEHTLRLAVSTGYPYVLATYPGTCDATALFHHMGFFPVAPIPADVFAGRTCFMRETRPLSERHRRRASDAGSMFT